MHGAQAGLSPFSQIVLSRKKHGIRSGACCIARGIVSLHARV
jgi:hypothetical protein